MKVCNLWHEVSAASLYMRRLVKKCLVVDERVSLRWLFV
jgi:hypothetical protein